MKLFVFENKGNGDYNQFGLHSFDTIPEGGKDTFEHRGRIYNVDLVSADSKGGIVHVSLPETVMPPQNLAVAGRYS